MSIYIPDIHTLSQAEINTLPRAQREEAAREILLQLRALKQENQLEFYQPVNPNARKIHLSTVREVITIGGNRSSKTDTHLVETVIQLTGIIPYSLGDYPLSKIRPPIQARLVCQSHAVTWDTVIKPKLQYWRWNGADDPSSELGHWGWIPRRFLINGKWADSWSEKHRMLTLTNGSTLQIMSYDQETEAFAGASLHLIIHDEGPPQSIYRENKMRIMDVSGRLMIAMTPPDDTSASWDAAWVYDELYCKGLSGPDKDPTIDTFTLFTEENRILSPIEVASIAQSLTPEQREVRLRGAFMHLGGRIYRQFCDQTRYWCFQCGDLVLAASEICSTCSGRVVPLKHPIEPFDVPGHWPVIYALDPHPRKAHAMAWYALDPFDKLTQVAELEVDDEPIIVRKQVEDLERNLNLNVVKRIIDPNMGKSPSGTSGRRNRTVQEDFADAGLRCDLADDNRDTARAHIRERLKPDERTEEPMFRVFNTCKRTIFQMLRYSWDEYARYSNVRDPKPKPRELHDDFPSLLGYVVNEQLTFRLISGSQRIERLVGITERIY